MNANLLFLSSRFILVMAEVNSESVLRALGQKWELNLDWMHAKNGTDWHVF